MPIVPKNYDSIYADQGAPKEPPRPSLPESIYDDNEISRVEVSRENAQKVPPDRAAKLLKLELQTGLPSGFIETNLEEVEKNLNQQSFDAERFRTTNPKFTSWLSQNQNHYALAKEDIGIFGQLERTVDAFRAGWGKAGTQEELASLLYRDMETGLNAADAMRRDEIKAALQAQAQDERREGKLPYVARQTGYASGQALRSIKVGAQGALAGATAGAGLGSFAGGVGAVPGATAGAAAGALTAGLAYSYQMESAFAYDELRNLKDIDGKPLDPAIAKNVARGVGILNSIIETGSDAALTMLVPGAKGLIGGLSRETINSQVKKALLVPTTRQAVISAVSKMTSGAAIEGMEEFFQALVNATGRETAQAVSGQAFVSDSAGQDLSEAATQARDAFVGMFFTGGLTHGAPEYISKMRDVTRAKQTQDFYLALGTGVTQSKAFQALPEKGQELVAAITQDGPMANAYIDPAVWNTYWQEKQVDPREIAAEVVGDGGKAYDEAVAAGHDLVVPTDRYARKIGPTEHNQFFAQEIRRSPEEMNAREAQAFFEEIEQQQNEPEQVITEEAEKPSAINDSARKVRDAVSEQLKAVGEDPQKAILYERAFRTMGQRLGADPLQLFEQYGLKIRRPETVENAEGTTMEQSKFVQTPEFKNWFGDSKVLDSSGNPLVVYHGTSEKGLKGNAFKKEFLGSVTKAKSAEAGFYFVSDKDTAIGYSNLANKKPVADLIKKSEDAERKNQWNLAQKYMEQAEKLELKSSPKGNIVEAYLSIKNPLEFDADNQRFLDISEEIHQAIEQAKSEGHDGVVIRNLIDNADWGSSRSTDHWIVFDPKQIKSVNNQGTFDPNNPNILKQDGDARGRIVFGNNRQFNIDLLKNADESTFFHETGHFYLEVLRDAVQRADAPQQVKDDFASLLKWFGVESGDQIKRKHHEQFARGFEAYLMEGKAPSSALRQAFARFKVWLISVYKTMKGLNVELSDSVRGVMDRLLATDEEIEAMRSVQNMNPLIADPKKIMGEKRGEAYMKAVEEARMAAEEKIAGQMLNEFRREQSAVWKEKEAAVRSEVEKEVSDRKEYLALETLQSTKPTATAYDIRTFKLSKEAITKDFPTFYLGNFPRPSIYTTDENGVHPDVAAQIFGFRSGSELLFNMENIEPKEKVIDEIIDERMRKLYPELLTDGNMPQKIMETIHNDKQAQVLRLELEYLAEQNMPALKEAIRKVVRRVPTEKDVREYAQKTIGSTKVSKINPRLYELAERRAAKLAGETFAKGDFKAAFDHKRNELVNHQLYREAIAAQEKMEKAMEKFRKILSSKKDEKLAKTRDMDLVNAARAVLSEFGLGKTDKPAASYMEQLKRYDPEMFETMEAVIQSATENAKDYRETTFDDFTALTDTVNSIWALAKRTRQILIDGKMVDRDGVIEELEKRLGELKKPEERRGYQKAVTNWEKTKLFLLGTVAALRRVESWADAMDGGESNGAFRKYIWNPISEATTQYRKQKRTYLKKFLDLVKPIEKDLAPHEIVSPELNYVFSGKAELLGAMLHTGNGSNLSKLLRGREWGAMDKEGNVDSNKWNSFIARMWEDGVLTKKDYEFLQAVWDLLEELKPEAQKAHKEMYGHYFNEVTANEIQTPWGKFRGGYVPAVVDPFIVTDAAIRQEKESLEKSDNSFMFPTAGRGFTKKRIEAYAAPLAFDLRFIPMHIDKVLRFINIEPRVKDVGRIVMNRGFRKTLDAFDPAVGGDMLVPWLQRAAQQKIETPSKGWYGRGWDAFWREMRRRTGLQVMTANVVNTLEQFTGILIGGLKVSPKYLRNALWDYIRNPKETAEEIADKSDFMKTRETAQIIEIQKTIDDLILNPSKYEKVRAFATQHGYFMQQATQNIVDTIVWSGAYEEAVAGGRNEKDAVREADAAVRQTQGSFAAEDMSRFETGTPFVRMFTMFYSFFNMWGNLLGTEFQKTIRDMGLKKGAGRMLYIYTMGFMIPAIIGAVLRRSMDGRPWDEDDDESYLDDALSLFFGSQFKTGSAMFPFIGPTVTATANMFNKKMYDDRISTSPAVSTLESAVSSPSSVYSAILENGSKKKAIRDTLTALGLLSGLPLAVLGKPAGYLADVAEGRAEPSGAIDFTRGLITGKAGKRN